MANYLNEQQTQAMLQYLKNYIDEGDKIVYDEVKKVAENGGTEHFERTDSTMATVGGLSQGSVIAGKTPAEVLESILFPYTKPSVSFSISPNTLLYENGTVVNSIKLIFNVTKRSKAIEKITLYANNSVVEILVTGVAAGGSFEYTYTPTGGITSDTTFKVSVSDGTSEVSASSSIYFTDYTYWGALTNDIAEITEANIVVQNKKLVNNKATTCTFTTVNQIMFYAIPSRFGKVNKIVDTFTNYDLNDWKSITITINSITYTVYYSGNGQVTDYKLQFS